MNFKQYNSLGFILVTYVCDECLLVKALSLLSLSS